MPLTALSIAEVALIPEQETSLVMRDSNVHNETFRIVSDRLFVKNHLSMTRLMVQLYHLHLHAC